MGGVLSAFACKCHTNIWKIQCIYLQVGREETNQRIELLQNIQKLKDENKKLEEEVSKYKDMDPETYHKLEEQTKV